MMICAGAAPIAAPKPVHTFLVKLLQLHPPSWKRQPAVVMARTAIREARRFVIAKSPSSKKNNAEGGRRRAANKIRH